MPSRELPYPVFDADNHFYEPKEALTQFLPDHRKGVIDYIDVRGRTKIMVRNAVSDYIPNPTFEVVARPGRPGGVLPARQRRQELPRGDGQADEGDPRVPRPRGAARGPRRPRPGLHADVPDAGQPRRGAAEGRSRPDPRHRPRAERVDVRDLAVQLRGPHLLHAGHQPGRSSTARSRNSSGAWSAAPRPCWSVPRRCPATAAPARSACEEFDPFWEACVKAGIPVSMHASDSGYSRVPQRLGARRRVQAVRADRVPDGRDGQAAHRGHHGRAGLPRRADPQPGSAHPVDRERRGLGALPVQAVQERLHEDAAGVPRGSDRGVPALRLRRAVLGGRLRPDGRPVRRRPGDLRFGLAAPGGPGRADQPGRRPCRASTRRASERSWAAT